MLSRKITACAPRGRRGVLVGVLGGAVVVAALAGCDVKRGNEDLVAGKQQFVAKCGVCHVLSRAQTSGTTGPNLDDAFRQSVRDGFHRSTFQGQIEKQILYLEEIRRWAETIKGHGEKVLERTAQVAEGLKRDVASLDTHVAAIRRPDALE